MVDKDRIMKLEAEHLDLMEKVTRLSEFWIKHFDKNGECLGDIGNDCFSAQSDELLKQYKGMLTYKIALRHRIEILKRLSEEEEAGRAGK